MKIDLNLDEVFDEEGNIDDSIKERIIQTITARIYNKIDKDLKEKLKDVVERGIKERVDITLSMLIPSLLDYEFTETSRYGAESTTTTVKNRILNDIQTQLVWKDGNYNSDKSPFTKSVKEIIEGKLKEFKPEFDKELNSRFVKEALVYAEARLKNSLGIK